jgi:AraC-like DNA-binding protein
MDKYLLKESRAHGDVMYPISIYTISCDSRFVFNCHWHDEQEFLFLTEGKALFHVGTSHYELLPGQGLFIPAGELHAAYAIDNLSYAFNALVFSSEILKSSTCDIIQSNYIKPFADRQFDFPTHLKGIAQWEIDILEMLSEIVKVNLRKSFAYELETKGLLCLALSRLLANSTTLTNNAGQSRDKHNIERLKTVLQLIQSDYQSKISLKTLASSINMSEEHFCRFFKKIMNRTPMDYLNCFRIQKAAKLLECTDKKIYEVALDVGFDCLTHFIATFRKYMGASPSDHRRKLCKAYASCKI